MAAVFAQQIGIDNDESWGRGRIIILAAGLVFILGGVLLVVFQNKLTEFKRHISTFFYKHFNVDRPTQILLVSFIAATIVLITYIWLVRPIARDARHNYNYYSELSIGFKLGNLYLTEEPSPALLSLSNPYNYYLRKQNNLEDFPWDVSLYNNKFYTYWGPAPSLILTIFSYDQLSQIGDHYVALAFAFGLFFYAALITATFWYKSLQNVPVWILGICLLAIGFSTPVTIMLESPRIYEAAIFGCQFFFVGGCYWAYSSISDNKPVLWKLVLAGIHWAFALGTRITILPVILFTAAATVIYIMKVYKATTPKAYLPILAIMGMPLLLALSGLSWYNWARFESIFEFGLKYQLTNVDYNLFKVSFSSRYITENLYNYFFHPLQIQSRFPYLQRVEYPSSNDKLAGLMYLSPYILLLSVPLVREISNFIAFNKKTGARQIKAPSENWLIIIFAGSCFIAMFVILSFYFVTMRYIEDFMPSLILLTTILLGREYQQLSQNNASRKVLEFITMMLVGVTIIANVLVAISNSRAALIIRLLNPISKMLGLK